MKKVLTLLFVAAALLTSCEVESLDPSLNPDAGGNSGTGSGNVTSSIVGDWLYTDVFTSTTISTTFMGNTTDLVAEIEFVSSDLILTFNTDGTYTAIGDLTFETFTAGMSAGNQTQSINDAGTYLITGDVIEFTTTSGTGSSPFAAGDVVQTIDTLDATDLIIDLDASTTQNIGGAVTVNVVEGSAEFERQ